jgi:exodeoxyribonuclease VII large subunit
MEPAGLGSLMAMLEKRKQMFEKEGLFDAARKRRLPFLPSRIGIVTSPTGAVIQDMLHRIEDRFPSYVQLWPVKVQGEGAAEEIAAAIAGFNAMDSPPDVLIVARGGGSIEDLWAFNEEIVVRAASGSHIPLVSAVGHETDTTLIDYAADVRAPTPTAAAEFVVPVKQEIEAGIYESYSRLKLSLERYLSERGMALKHAFERLPTPEYWLMEKRQRVDQYEWRLLSAIRQRLVELDKRLSAVAANITHPKHTVSINQERLGHLGERLLSATRQRLVELDKRLSSAAANIAHPKHTVSLNQERLGYAWERLQRVIKQSLSDREQRMALHTKLLESYSYTNTLQRGFTLVRNGEGKLVASGADIHSGDKVAIEFFDAAYDATIEGKIDE